MLLKVQFVFFDMRESLVIFLLDYVAVMALIAAAGHYLLALIRKLITDEKTGE